MGLPRSEDDARGATGAVVSREPVFRWTPSDSASVDWALQDRMTVDDRERASVDRLRFGTCLASNTTAVGLYELITEEVDRRLNLPSELVVETSYESCEKDPNEECFVCSLPFVTFERRGLDFAVPIAAPVLPMIGSLSYERERLVEWDPLQAIGFRPSPVNPSTLGAWSPRK